MVVQEQTASNEDCTGCANQSPTILAENNEAWQLWLMANTQWRVGLSLSGLDYPAVFQIAAVNGIAVTPGVFRKLKALELYELDRQSKKVSD